LIFFIFGFTIPAYSADTLTFATYNAAATKTSFAILKKAYSKLGIEIITREYPAKRALVQSSSGRTDGEVQRIAAVADGYPTLKRVPFHIDSIEGHAFTCGDSVEIKGWRSLRELNVGIRIGSRFAEIPTQDMPHVVRKPYYDDVFDMLVAGEIDVVIATINELKPQKKRRNMGCLKMNEPALSHLPMFHFLHEKNEIIVPAITKTLQNMLQSGEIDQIKKEIQN